jgi:hypothetical protein
MREILGERRTTALEMVPLSLMLMREFLEYVLPQVFAWQEMTRAFRRLICGLPQRLLKRFVSANR